MRDAGTAVWAATTSLAAARLPDPAAATAAITAWQGLVEACRRHGWVLLGTDTRVEGLRQSAGTQPVDRAAVDLVDQLAALTRSRMRDPGTADTESLDGSPPGQIAAQLDTARRTLGAGGDLLATHRRLDGSSASPDAAILDEPGVRAAGYRRLAEVAIPVLAAGDALALRAGQAGLTWSRIRPAVPDTAVALDAAIVLRSLALADRADSTRLDRFQVARPRVRNDHPLAELTDRIARLRRVAWAAAQQSTDDVGVTALTDIANTALALHHATETLLARARHPGLRGGAGEPRYLQRIHAAGQHWVAATEQLAKLRSITPGHLGIRRDAHRIRSLLTAMVDNPTETPAAVPTLLRLCDAQPDVAGWTAIALRGLAASGGLYVRGRTLTGDQVTDAPDLVKAKLEDRLIPAPPETLEVAGLALRRASTTAGVDRDVPLDGCERSPVTR